MARPMFAGQSEQHMHTLDYPGTDKFFFPGYDIRQVNLFSVGWRDCVPWDEAQTLRIYDAPDVRAYVACNIVFLENLPQGEVHVAARVRTTTTSSMLQRAARALFESRNDGVVSAEAVGLQYFPASADILEDGRAAVFIPGIKSVDDIAAIAVKQPGKPLVWRRVTVAR